MNTRTHSKKTARILAMILSSVMMLTLLSGCFTETDSPSVSSETETSHTDFGVVLTTGENSDFSIVANPDNEAEYAFAKSLQSRIYELSGAMLTLKKIGSTDENKPRILIGNTGAGESSALYESLEEDDFALRLFDENTFAIGVSKSSRWENVRAIMERDIFLGASLESISIPLRYSFRYRSDCPDGIFGSCATIPKDGSSDYVLIFGDDFLKSQVKVIAQYLEDVTGVSFAVKSDRSENEHEIILGKTDRDGSSLAMAQVSGYRNYCMSVVDDDLVINGTDIPAILQGVCRFSKILAQSSGPLTLYESDNVVTTYETPTYEPDYPASVSLYQTMFEGTYSSYVDQWKDLLSEDEREDQVLIETLVDYLDTGVAFVFDSSTAIWNGRFVKLNPDDYTQCAKLTNNDLLVPVGFLNSYFGISLAGDESGYWNLSVKTGLPDFSLLVNTELKIGILMPGNDTEYQNPTDKCGSYTHRQLWEKIAALYTDPLRREPDNATEQTREILAEAIYRPETVYDYTKTAYRTLYSPGICSVTESGKDVLYVSYESCMVTNFATESGNVTYLLRSEDDGKTWQEVGKVPEMRWACVFFCKRCVYLLGTQLNGSRAMIGEYRTETGDFRYVNLGVTGGAGAPCSVLIFEGRIYKADGDRMMSALITDDLLQASSWSFSENRMEDLLTKQQYLTAINGTAIREDQTFSYGEANVVEYNGTIYMIARIDAGDNWGYVAIAEVSSDGSKLSFVTECGSLVSLPTSTSKFSIRYDESSGLYLTMISVPTLSGGHAAKQRNVLALYASKDLIHWSEVDVLLSDRELMTPVLSARAHGFQYVDFAVVGNDLKLVVREATGITNSYHDGKYISLYTVSDFRNLISDKCPSLVKE